MMLSLTSAAFGPVMRETAFQTGKVLETAAVTFSEGPVAPRATIATFEDPLARPGRAMPEGFRAPMTSGALRMALLDRARAKVAEGLDASRDQLVAALRATPEAGGDGPVASMLRGIDGDAPTLEALMTPEVLAALPPTIADALTARVAALRGADALAARMKIDLGAQISIAQAEEDRALISRAISAQVDARLAADRAADEARTQVRLSTLALFGEAGAGQVFAEKMMQLGRETERLGRRKGMIREMTRAVERGTINAVVTRATAWAGSAMLVTEPKGATGMSVFAQVSDRLSAASLSLDLGAKV